LLSQWRSDGTLRRDPRPSLYAYEQTYRVPGTDREAVRRGVFARVGLEPLGPGSGVRAHERTLSGPREDRYKLLRATNVNTSPVVGLFEDPSGTVADALAEVAAAKPVAAFTDEDGVAHRLWALPAGDDDTEDAIVSRICRRASHGPITLADGHHRYETGLRYATERRVGHVGDDDPAWAAILMLLLEPIAGPLTVLATHRLVLDLDDASLEGLLRGLPELFDVRRGVAPDELVAAFGSPDGPAGGGRFGLWTRHGGAILDARHEAFGPWLPAGGGAVRRLDVTLAGVALERLAGLHAEAVAEGGRLAYTRDVHEALRRVDEGDASLALLLHPTPAAEILAVAADGDVMPQKSTYIYPKALSGLVVNPLE
jgi:uncharacterized protein (DUF1015 family)